MYIRFDFGATWAGPILHRRAAGAYICRHPYITSCSAPAVITARPNESGTGSSSDRPDYDGARRGVLTNAAPTGTIDVLHIATAQNRAAAGACNRAIRQEICSHPNGLFPIGSPLRFCTGWDGYQAELGRQRSHSTRIGNVSQAGVGPVKTWPTPSIGRITFESLGLGFGAFFETLGFGRDPEWIEVCNRQVVA